MLPRMCDISIGQVAPQLKIPVLALTAYARVPPCSPLIRFDAVAPAVNKNPGEVMQIAFRPSSIRQRRHFKLAATPRRVA